MIGDTEPAWTTKANSSGHETDLRAADFAGRRHLIYCHPLGFTSLEPEFENERVAQGDRHAA